MCCSNRCCVGRSELFPIHEIARRVTAFCELSTKKLTAARTRNNAMIKVSTYQPPLTHPSITHPPPHAHTHAHALTYPPPHPPTHSPMQSGWQTLMRRGSTPNLSTLVRLGPPRRCRRKRGRSSRAIHLCLTSEGDRAGSHSPLQSCTQCIPPCLPTREVNVNMT